MRESKSIAFCSITVPVKQLSIFFSYLKSRLLYFSGITCTYYKLYYIKLAFNTVIPVTRLG